ncbi:EcsC family protein [Mycobacterium sp. 050128]|uniref:EcsC family protein n=1 Tax=Mycobacterium sp. 050128 TaxID=3096112 RepID=UPI002ED8527D
MALSEYEQEQLAKVTAHKERVLGRKSRRLLPFDVRGIGPGLVNKLVKAPGVKTVTEPVVSVVDATAEGVGKVMSRTSQLTTSDTRVVSAYAKKGHAVQNLDDIGKLDLKTIDDVASFTLLHHAYSLSAAAEGAAAGLVISGGEAVTAAGAAATAGAAAVPGLGAVATAMGVDAAALLTACTGVVAQHALYYGYDPREPAEEIFMMQVIGLGLAGSVAAKAAAYQQLATLTESLARDKAWQELDQQTFAKVVQKFAVNFAESLATKKLGQLVPVIGVGIGAALNWKAVNAIADAAYWAYRERFLYEKGGEVDSIAINVDRAEDDLPAIDVVDILKSEGVHPGE